MDGEIRKAFQRSLTKQGFKFKLNTKVTAAKKSGSGVVLSLEPSKGGATEELEADVVLVSAGRRPFLNGLNLEAAGVSLDERGRVATDGHFKTTSPSGTVFAIGDVIAGPMLAHKAEEDGVACVENLAGEFVFFFSFCARKGSRGLRKFWQTKKKKKLKKKVAFFSLSSLSLKKKKKNLQGKSGHVNYATVPSIVYTWPEAASVGQTEEEVKAAGTPYKTGKFAFMANSRARASDDAEGVVKFVAHADTDKILGAHIMGPNAGELIAECVLAMEYGATSEDIARTCHGHPTLSEAIKEAALATYDKPIHM